MVKNGSKFEEGSKYWQNFTFKKVVKKWTKKSGMYRSRRADYKKNMPLCSSSNIFEMFGIKMKISEFYCIRPWWNPNWKMPILCHHQDNQVHIGGLEKIQRKFAKYPVFFKSEKYPERGFPHNIFLQQVQLSTLESRGKYFSVTDV